MGRAKALQDAPRVAPALILSAEDVVRYLPQLTTAEQEHLWVLGLNGRQRVVSSHCAAIGTVDRVTVVLRDVFRELVRVNAASFLICHNHPSGAVDPSAQDSALTLKIQEGGTLLGIVLLDHIIIGADGHYSFADHGILPRPDKGR